MQLSAYELSFILMILLKSMFSLPSATMMRSPHISLRLNPFFAFIVVGCICYFVL